MVAVEWCFTFLLEVKGPGGRHLTGVAPSPVDGQGLHPSLRADGILAGRDAGRDDLPVSKHGAGGDLAGIQVGVVFDDQVALGLAQADDAGRVIFGPQRGEGLAAAGPDFGAEYARGQDGFDPFVILESKFRREPHQGISEMGRQIVTREKAVALLVVQDEQVGHFIGNGFIQGNE